MGVKDTSYFSSFNTTSGFRFILSDGVQVRFTPQTYPLCDYNDGRRSQGNCAFIMVDVNGTKKPNILGRDIFWFVLKNDGLYPRGCDSGSIWCNNSNGGDDCACKVIRENAMNY